MSNAGKRLIAAAKEARKVVKMRKWYPLNPKKHGIGGLLGKPFYTREQDRRASPDEFFAVVFFPK